MGIPRTPEEAAEAVRPHLTVVPPGASGWTRYDPRLAEGYWVMHVQGCVVRFYGPYKSERWARRKVNQFEREYRELRGSAAEWRVGLNAVQDRTDQGRAERSGGLDSPRSGPPMGRGAIASHQDSAASQDIRPHEDSRS